MRYPISAVRADQSIRRSEYAIDPQLVRNLLANTIGQKILSFSLPCLFLSPPPLRSYPFRCSLFLHRQFFRLGIRA